MADESKKKAYYNSLVRAGVVPSEVSYEAFNLKIRDTNFAKIVYSGLKTASDLNIVEDIPSEQQFNSVLQVGQFPTEPEISKKTNQLQPNVGSTQTNQPQQISPTTTTDVVAEEETPQQGVPARTFPSPEQLRQPVTNQPLPSVGMPPTNQPQPTAEETQIAPIDQQAGQVQGGMPQGKGLGAGQFQITDIRTQAEKPQTVPDMPIMEPIQQTTTTPIGQATPLTSPPPEQVGYFDYLGNAVQRGLNRGEIADYISATGKTPTAEEFARIAELNAENERLFTSKAMQDFSSNPDIESTLKSLPEIAVESIASLYRHGLARMATGAVAGGVAGSVIPAAGTLAGAGTGILSGMSVAGLGLEVSGTIMEGLNELKINTKDPEALKNAFSNPAVMDYLKQKAYARGIPIAAINAVSMGVAGKLIGKPVASAVGRGLQVLGEAGIQGGFGATGELLAQINSGEKIKGYEVLAEGLAEIPGSIPEVGIAVLSKNKGAGKDTKVESARLALKSPDMSTEAINEVIDVGVGTGEINATQATELKQEVAKANEINAKIPAEIKDTELRVTAIGLIEERDNLTAQLETVDEAFKPAIQEKIKGINEQLQELTQIPQQQGTQAFFETNQPSQTNPLLRLPESVDAVMDKIDQGILVSAESLFDVYNNVQTAIRETLANRVITPEERVATINILSGMLSDIDRANTEGQMTTEDWVQKRDADWVRFEETTLEAWRSHLKGEITLDEYNAIYKESKPKLVDMPSITKAREVKQKTNVLPSSGQTIVTPETKPATEPVAEVVSEPVIAISEPVATATEVATETQTTPQTETVETVATTDETEGQEGGQVNPALADVESTAKALEGKFQNKDDDYFEVAKSVMKELKRNTSSKDVAEAYHSAKAKPESERTAQETELITQVEQLLTPTQDAVQKQTAGQVPVQSGTTSSQEVAKGEPKAEPQSTAKQGQAETTTTQEEVGDTEVVSSEIANISDKTSVRDLASMQDGEVSAGVFSELNKGDKITIGGNEYVVTTKTKGTKKTEFKNEKGEDRYYTKSTITLKKVNKDGSLGSPISGTFVEYSNRGSMFVGGDAWRNLSRDIEGDITVDLINENNKFHEPSQSFKLAQQYVDKINAEVEKQQTSPATKQQTTAQTTPTAEATATTTTEVTLNTPNETTVKDITKIENATEKGRELALAKPVNKWVKRAFDNYEDISSRAKKAGIYDGTTLKIGGKEYTVDTPAKFKAFLAQSQNNFDAINEAVNKSEIDTLKAERDALVQEFIKGMGKATMNLNPQQVSILAQLAWKNIQIIAKQSNLSSNAIASLIKRKIDEAINELNQMLTQSGQQPLNPDKEDITNIINNVRKLTQGIATTSTSTAGQIGTAGQISATQSPVYTKEQEELAREKAKKMDEGKPFIARSEPFWTAVKRKVAELRQKLDSPKEMLNFVEKMIGTAPGSSYQTTRELPLGRAMEQLRGKARALALPYMERVSEALKPIEKHLPDFEKYLIYRRIIDRAQQDKLNQEGYNQGLLKDKPKRRTTGGMTETDADILLNDLANKVGPEVFNQFIDAGDNLQVIFDDNLKDLVDAGVLTQDRYNAIKAQNEFYVPFDVVQRDFRGNVITGTEYDRSTAQGQKVIQEIEGIKTPKNAADVNSGIDVFFKMMQNGDIDVDSYYYLATEHITDARNSGAITQQEYESLMDAISEPALELHSPLNKALNIINASQYQVARQGYMNDVDRLIDADTNNDYFKRLEDGDKLPSGMSVITYYKDGVQQRVAVDTKLKQAIDGMSKPELTAFEQALKIGSIPFKIAATSASVSFLPVNFVIDTVRTLTSKAGLGSGANATERVASVVQVPILYSEALVESIIGNLLNTKLGNALGLKSITPNFMYEQYEEWRKSPSYSEGTYMNYFTDKLKSGRTKTEIEDAKFLENVQRRTQTILGKPETAKAIAEAMLGAKQKTRMTADSLFDIINLIGKILENSHKIYGYTKLSGTETGVRKGLDRYIGGYIDKLNNRKKLTQTELENALDEVTDEVLNNIGSPNFEQIPPNMRAASVWLPFLGAAVKGNMTDMSRMLNAINTGASKKEQKDALAFAARNGAIFTIPAFMTGLAMALKDDDDENKKMYDEMDENSKWKNMIIPIEKEVDGQAKQIDFVTIPIRGLPVIFNSIGRASGQALGMAMKERLTKDEIKRISKDLLYSSGSEMMTFNLADKTYLSNIDPETGERKETRKQEEWINRSMSALSGINPLIKYPLERVANKNFFGKYPIEPESIRGKRLRNAILNETNNPQTSKPYSPSLLKNKFTPEYAVTLSQKLERNGIRMTPMVIDHFFDTFLAGAPEKFDVGASELMKRRFLWKERKLAYGEKPKN